MHLLWREMRFQYQRLFFLTSYKFVALVEKEQPIPDAYPLNWFCSSKANGGLILKNQDEEFEWNCVLLLLFCVWLHWKRSLYVNSSSLAGKMGTCFISITVPAEACGCDNFSLKAFFVSPEVISKVDLNKFFPSAGLYSVLSAVGTQQHQLCKLQPLQVLLCWHLLPVHKQENTAKASFRFLSHSP